MFCFLHVDVEFGIINKFPGWSLTIQHRHETFLSTSPISKCREKIKWRRHFISNGYEVKQTTNKKINNRKFGWNSTEI